MLGCPRQFFGSIVFRVFVYFLAATIYPLEQEKGDRDKKRDQAGGSTVGGLVVVPRNCIDCLRAALPRQPTVTLAMNGSTCLPLAGVTLCCYFTDQKIKIPNRMKVWPGFFASARRREGTDNAPKICICHWRPATEGHFRLFSARLPHEFNKKNGKNWISSPAKALPFVNTSLQCGKEACIFKRAFSVSTNPHRIL